MDSAHVDLRKRKIIGSFDQDSFYCRPRLFEVNKRMRHKRFDRLRRCTYSQQTQTPLCHLVHAFRQSVCLIEKRLCPR